MELSEKTLRELLKSAYFTQGYVNEDSLNTAVAELEDYLMSLDVQSGRTEALLIQ